MKVVQEVTDWDVPNHVYFLNDSRDKMLAYVQAGTNTVKTFSRPLGFDARGRKFREVPNTWNYTGEDDLPSGRTIKVEGSKGAVYTVVEQRGKYTCTCSGFKFRGHCRHIDAAKEQQ